MRHLQSLQLHLGWHPLNGQAPSLALLTVLGHYPGIIHSTHSTYITQALRTVPGVPGHRHYPCPGLLLLAACIAYTATFSLWWPTTVEEQEQLLWKERERAEQFHSLGCTGSLKPAFQTSFKSYLTRNKEKNSLAYKCILVVVV